MIFLFLWLFLKLFGGHKSFLWGHWYPYLGLLLASGLGFKIRVDSLTYMLCHLYTTDSSDSFLGVTPADLLAANMAAKLFHPHTCKIALVGPQLQDQAWHCLTTMWQDRCSTKILWLWPNDLGSKIWPRYYKDWSECINEFITQMVKNLWPKHAQLHRQTLSEILPVRTTDGKMRLLNHHKWNYKF